MAVWVAQGSSGSLHGIGFLNRRNKVFHSHDACPPPRTGSWRLGVFASPPRRIFLLAKAQSRKEIIVRSVWLPEAFASSRALFFSSRNGCRPRTDSLRLGIFAACPAELRGANNFFFFYSRKGIERSFTNLLLLGSCLPTEGRPARRGGFLASSCWSSCRPPRRIGRELTFVQSCFF
jgi:hypothetical protein